MDWIGVHDVCNGGRAARRSAARRGAPVLRRARRGLPLLLLVAASALIAVLIVRAPDSFSVNDRSRWLTIRALVDTGTYAIGRRYPLEDGTYRDRGLVTEPGWDTVDMVMHPNTGRFYSTKPPLLTTVLAGEYWVLQRAFGWQIVRDRAAVTATIVLHQLAAVRRLPAPLRAPRHAPRHDCLGPAVRLRDVRVRHVRVGFSRHAEQPHRRRGGRALRHLRVPRHPSRRRPALVAIPAGRPGRRLDGLQRAPRLCAGGRRHVVAHVELASPDRARRPAGDARSGRRLSLHAVPRSSAPSSRPTRGRRGTCSRGATGCTR